MNDKSVFQEISIDDILEPENDCRTVIIMEGLQELAESIKVKGIIQPIIVMQKNNKYEIIDGHRRFLAAKIAGLAVVPCLIRAMNVREADLAKLHANYFREDVNPVDEAKYFVKLHDKYSLSYSEIAKMCSRSDTYVVNRVNVLQSDVRVLAALEGRQINFSQGVEICRASNENIRRELLRITIESGATVEALHLMRYDFEARDRGQEFNAVSGPAGGGSYPELKHLIECPICRGNYPVNTIYPISVCKTCYDGFLEGLKATEKDQVVK